MEDFIKYFTDNKIAFIIDMAIILLLFLVITFVSIKKLKSKLFFIVPLIYLALMAANIFLGLAYSLFATSIFTVCALTIFAFSTKDDGRDHKRVQLVPEKKNSSRFVSSEDEKNRIIEVLLKTCEYFSQRKVGALITIEQENSLNTYIDKAVKLDAEITSELLKTIFFPNTALHDGAVIIRGNRIVCATAFYTPSDKADIERDLGSRHRAAIGISEDSDAFTIVVSEETGQISTTSRGTIERDKTADALRVALSQHIFVEKGDK